MRSFKLILALGKLVIILLMALKSYAVEAPRFLYHWTSARGLERWAEQIKKAGEFQFKALDVNSSFLGAYPQLSGVTGVFTWTDPVTAMGSFSAYGIEWYAREDHRAGGEPARMVVIEIKPGAEVVELITTVDRDQNFISEVDPKAQYLGLMGNSKPGLILHKMVDTRTQEVFLQEYVLLKRGYVEMITADPDIIRSHLVGAQNRLNNPLPFTKQEMHFTPDAETYGVNSFSKRQELRAMISRTLQVPSARIPEFFRSSPVVTNPYCSQTFF